jgi:HSP20 family protein
MLNAWDAVPTLDRMVDDVMRSIAGTATNTRNFEPAIDVRANDEAIVFVCDVPGVKNEDLDVTLDDHVLTIKGRRKYESDPKEQVLLGRAYGVFERSFTLPDSLDEAGLEAKLDSGVLTIRVPKQPKAKPRKIAIAK